MFGVYIVLAFIAVAYFILAYKKKVLMTLYRKQATKRNGRVKSLLFLFPKLILFNNSGEISIIHNPGGKNSPPITYMKCTLNSRKNYKFSISPENALVKFGKSFGLKDIQIGNSEFDESFLIRSNDDLIVRSFLAPEIQESILEIEEHFPRINFENQSFNFSISGWIDEENKLDQFIEAGLKMIEKVNRTC